jgi:hypothetical protein
MKSLLVTRVQPFTPDSESAEVTLQSERGEITVFSHPCEVKVGDTVPNHVFSMDAEAQAAFLHDWPEDEQDQRSAERLERIGTFSYRGCGRVVNQSEGLIEVLGFVIDLGDVPCDGPIEFECKRLDL